LTNASSSVPPHTAETSFHSFSFAPAEISVPAGSTVTWTNHDDVPHNVVSTQQKFKSPVLDTDQKFSRQFKDAGGPGPGRRALIRT